MSDVHCHACCGLLAFDRQVGAWVHATVPRQPHLADPIPRELRAYRQARKEAYR